MTRRTYDAMATGYHLRRPGPVADLLIQTGFTVMARSAAPAWGWNDLRPRRAAHRDRAGLGEIRRGNLPYMAKYLVNPAAVARATRLIEARQYVLDSDWGEAQPSAAAGNTFLESHSWDDYAQWHLGLTEGATDQTKGRYAFAYGDFRRVHRTGLIACVYRAAEWRHKDIEIAAHDLLQLLDRRAG